MLSDLNCASTRHSGSYAIASYQPGLPRSAELDVQSQVGAHWVPGRYEAIQGRGGNGWVVGSIGTRRLQRERLAAAPVHRRRRSGPWFDDESAARETRE